MSDFPQIFTFYSFKGGVGRSMAVLNVAYALVAKGRNVLVLDMDLEAPGLSGFLRRQKEIGAFARYDVVDLVRWAVDFSNACQPSSPPLDAASFPPLTDFIVSVPREKLESMPHPYAELGRLDIVPVDEERDYYERLTGLAMGGFQQDALIRVGSILRAWLKSRRFTVEVPDYYGPEAERTGPYDYVLVDSRTGITETGGLCIGPLSDQLVVLTALNDQNVQGTRRFLEEVGILAKPSAEATEAGQRTAESARRLDPKPTLIVASPVPAGEIATKRDRLNKLEAAVGKAAVKLSYHPQMALMESIFTRDYREEYLAREYDALLREVLEMASDITYPDVSDLIVERPHAPPSAWRDAVAQSLRFASATGIDWPLDFLLKTLNVDKLREDRDFISWDRMCRVLSRGKEAAHLDAFGTWADVLSQWSLCSTDPELTRLRREAGARCYERVLQDEGASPRQKALALANRGVTSARLGDSEQAITDYTAVLQMPDAPTEQKAQALVNRGITYGEGGDSERTIADYTAVLQMPDAPAEQKAQALLCRGITYGQGGDSEREVADYTVVLQMPDAPAEQKAQALVNRGITYGQGGDSERTIADYTAVLQMPDAPAEQKAQALVNRGIMYGEGGDSDREIADYTAVLQMPDAPAEQKAQALVYRGITYGQGGDSEREIADYMAVLQMPDAPAEQKAQALLYRGITYGQGGDSEREIADYTVVLQMPDAPAEQKAQALVNRGITHGEGGDSERAIADYTTVLQMPDAPAEQKAQALVNRGWRYVVEGRSREATEDEQHAVSLDPNDCTAHANLAVALLADGQTNAAFAAYDSALALAKAEHLAEMTSNLEMATQKYGPLAGADEVLIRINARRESLEH